MEENRGGRKRRRKVRKERGRKQVIGKWKKGGKGAGKEEKMV